MSDLDPGVWRDIAATISGCTAAHRHLVEHLRTHEPVEPASPSRLPDWTVGHVLAHLARNADSHLSLMDGQPQYPHGIDGRNADIEAGAGRRWSELVDDVARSAAAVESRWDEFDEWEGTARMAFGERPRHLLPMLRWREVEIHRVDLGLGYEFADMPAEYVRRDLRLLEMQWRARRPMGLTPLPAAVHDVDPATRLAWFTGRAEIDGVEPAAVF